MLYKNNDALLFCNSDGDVIMVMTDVCREKETDILKEQIDKLNIAIVKEEEKAHDLETKAQYVILSFVCLTDKQWPTYIKLYLHVLVIGYVTPSS